MNAQTKIDNATVPAKADEPGQQVATVSDYSSSLMEVIAKAARDPSVDVEKMERLFAMQERLQAREAKLAFIEGKLAMRPELPAITMRGSIIIRDKNNPDNIMQETPFAKFEDVQEAIEPVLLEHGFDLGFRNGLSDEGKVRVTTILTHREGHSEETYFDLPMDTSGSKNNVQAVGSSTSYAKRYGVISILNLRVMGQDDDGASAVPPLEISVKQFDQLGKLIAATGSDKDKFEKFLVGAGKLQSGGSLSDLPAENFDFAKDALVMKAGKSGGEK